MKADIKQVRIGYYIDNRKQAGKLWLINTDQTDMTAFEFTENRVGCPGAVAKFDSNWIFFEFFKQVAEVAAIGSTSIKLRRKLNQNCKQLTTKGAIPCLKRASCCCQFSSRSWVSVLVSLAVNLKLAGALATMRLTASARAI